MPDIDFETIKQQLDRLEAKEDWNASAINALNIELARQFGKPFLDKLHVPPYPEPNTIPDETPLPNNTGVSA
jgi:hypothetical protein